MEIKSARDIINCRNYLFKKLEICNAKLDELNKSAFSNFKEKRLLKEKIEELDSDLRSIEKILVTSTNFKSSDFYEFLKKFVSLTEENYELYVLRIADAYPQETFIEKIKRERAWKRGERIDTVQGKWCYFMSDVATKEFIEENIFDEDELEDFIDSKNDDTIVIDNFYTKFFNKNTKMKEEYRKHPRLKTAIYELVNLKLKHPELTDEERFNKVLKNTVRRNLDKGYDNEKRV